MGSSVVVSALDDGGEDEGKDDIVILRTLSVWETAAEGEKGNLRKWKQILGKNFTKT